MPRKNRQVDRWVKVGMCGFREPLLTTFRIISDLPAFFHNYNKLSTKDFLPIVVSLPFSNLVIFHVLPSKIGK